MVLQQLVGNFAAKLSYYRRGKEYGNRGLIRRNGAPSSLAKPSIHRRRVKSGELAWHSLTLLSLRALDRLSQIIHLSPRRFVDELDARCLPSVFYRPFRSVRRTGHRRLQGTTLLLEW